MKLIQLNAWGGRLEPQIRNFLKAEQPDIVCLQEVIKLGAEGSGLFLPLKGMQTAAGLPFAAMAPAFSFNYMHSVAEFGNCVLANSPIKSAEVVFTHSEHEPNFNWTETIANMRNFVHAEVMVNNTPCHVITYHGFWIPDHKNGNDETLKQMLQIADYVKGLTGPIILTGDFNLAPHSESLEKINAILGNLSVSHNLKTTRTHLTHKTEICDYIFVNDLVKVKDFHASDEIVSDHRALILEFDL
jgi:endonuclease/exonuclease/phosphatase family metal-dependent hydrolase